MGSSFPVPTIDELHEVLVADYLNRFPNDDVTSGSDNWKRLRVLALAASSLHAHNSQVYEDLMPDGADGEFLDRIGAVYDVTRKQATAAKKTDALRVVGTVASTFTVGDQLTSSDLTVFQLNESGSIPAAGFIDVDVIAVTLGSVGRKEAGTVLTFVSPPSGIESEAELQLDMDEDGDDVESDGAYRTRILDHLASPGMGGNANDYKAWALEVTGISGAYVYALRGGLGTVHLAALHAQGDSSRHLTQDERDELYAYVSERRPVGTAGFAVLSTSSLLQTIDVKITPISDEFEFDWDDSAGVTLHGSTPYDSATRTAKLSAARPVSMKVGHRVSFGNNSVYEDGAGEEVYIEALVSTDSFVISKTPAGGTMGNNAPVYSGGPLVAPIRAAIIAHGATLGPARALALGGTYAVSVWDDVLRVSNLMRICQTQEGVLETEMVQPSTNFFAYDNPYTLDVGVFIPGIIIIRRKW
jgi:uncharacterized phage protein gp47/JayE